MDALTFSLRIPKGHLHPPPGKHWAPFWRKPALESTRSSPAKLNPLWAAKFHERGTKNSGVKSDICENTPQHREDIDVLPPGVFFLAPAAS